MAGSIGQAPRSAHQRAAYVGRNGNAHGTANRHFPPWILLLCPSDRFSSDLLSEAHSSANRARQRTKDVFEEDIKEDLVWVKNRINRPNIGIKELQRARSLWDWHAQFEDEPALKQIAEGCEAVYLGNSSAREFGQRVHRLRRAKDWSQEICAFRARIGVRTLQMIES
jgi:hypothetical protein